jgi:hypothetical protein
MKVGDLVRWMPDFNDDRHAKNGPAAGLVIAIEEDVSVQDGTTWVDLRALVMFPDGNAWLWDHSLEILSEA